MERSPIDFTHIFQKENGDCFVNTLDHILTLKRSSETIIDAGVIHLMENMSDHAPIYCVIKCNNNIAMNDPEDSKSEEYPRPRWKDANPDQKLEFNDILFRKLFSMEIPNEVTSCRDIHCENEEHKKQIDSFINDILENVSDSGYETLPLSQPVKENTKNVRKKTAGWKEFVEPSQDTAKFWHAIWISAGRPLNTELHKIMKRTRNQFCYQVRKCKKVENFIKNKKIVDNCLDGDMDLFAEIKRQRSNPNDDDITIDGAAGKNPWKVC